MSKIQKAINKYLKEVQIQINLENLRMIGIVQDKQLQISIIKTIFKILINYLSHIIFHWQIPKTYSLSLYQFNRKLNCKEILKYKNWKIKYKQIYF